MERDLINQTISINNVRFRILKEIPRCSATNIKPKTSNYDLNIPQMLKKNYNHINMGIYLWSNDAIRRVYKTWKYQALLLESSQVK